MDIQDVDFTRRSMAKTRNGHVTCVGVEVMEGALNNSTRLTTRSSKSAGGAWVDIPNEDLPAVCVALWPDLIHLVRAVGKNVTALVGISPTMDAFVAQQLKE